VPDRHPRARDRRETALSVRNSFAVTRLRPHQRAIALVAVFGASYVAVLVVSRIDQKMVAETLSWCALLVIATLTYVILDARPGRLLGLATLVAAAVALLAPFSLLSYHVSPTFAYANINWLAPIGFWGMGTLLIVAGLAMIRAWWRHRSQGN